MTVIVPLKAQRMVSIKILLQIFTGVMISPWPDQEGNKLGSMSGTSVISKTSGRELSTSPPPPPLQSKAPKERRRKFTPF